MSRVPQRPIVSHRLVEASSRAWVRVESESKYTGLLSTYFLLPLTVSVMADNNFIDPSLLQRINDRKQAIWLRIGSLHESVNNSDRALAAYDACLTHNQSNVEALIKMGLLYMRKESIPPAINYLFTAVSIDPENGAAWGALAYSYVMADDYDKAYYAYYNTLHKLTDHRDPNLWFGIGILYDRLGMLESALTAFNAVIELDPAFDRLDEVLYAMGLIHKERGNHNASYTYMAKIISLSTSANAQAEAWYQLGTLHDITEAVTTASEAYHNALSKNENHVKAMQALAWLMHRNGNDNEAVDMLQRAARCDDSNAESYYLIGRIYMANNEFRVAYDNYQRAVHLDGKNPHFWCSIASLYYHRQQHRDAIDAYSRAIQINPDMPDVWFDLGTLYEMYNQFGDALDSYRQALQLHPHNASISQRIQAVQQGMVGGVPSSRPTGKPSCDAPDVSPTTRSGQRLHYKSDAPGRYGHLPAPPRTGPLTDPGTAAQHGGIAERADGVPISSGLLDHRHSQGAVVPASAQHVSIASPMRSGVRVANGQDGNMLTANNVAVTSPDRNQDSAFPQRSGQNLLTDSAPISQGPAQHDNQPLGATPTNAEGVNGVTQLPRTKTDIVAGSNTLHISSSGPGDLAPISPRLGSLVRPSQDSTALKYSRGQQGSKPDVTFASRDQNGPNYGSSSQGIPKFQLDSTNGTVGQDAPSRSENSWQNRNGKTGPDDFSSHGTRDGNGRIWSLVADTRVKFSGVEDQSAAYSSYPDSVCIPRSAPEHGEGKNRAKSQGIPASSPPLTLSGQYPMEREAPQRVTERNTEERQSSVGTVVPRATELSSVADAPTKDGLGGVTAEPNLKLDTSRDPSANSIPSPAEKGLPLKQTASSAGDASVGSVGKNEHGNKSADINQAHPDSKGNSRSDYHPSPRVSTPAGADRFGLSMSSVKDDPPVDEEMLPRLPPLPPSSDCHQGKDSVAAGEERFEEHPKGRVRLGQAESKQIPEGISPRGSDSNIRCDKARDVQELASKSGHDSSRQGPVANDIPRSEGQRSGFNAIIQEPAMSQSRIFKSTGFSEFRSPREGVSFTKPANSLSQDDVLQRGIKQGMQNEDFDSKIRRVGSVAEDGRRSPPSTQGAGVCVGSDETREHGQIFGVSSLRKDMRTGTTTGSQSSNRASPERRSFGSGNRSGMQPTSDDGAYDKTEKIISHRVVPSTGIRSSPAGGGGELSIKRSGPQRLEGRNLGDKDDRDSPTDSHKLNRVSSLRNPFGGGVSSSFAKPAPRSGGVGSIGVSSVQEPGLRDVSGQAGTSEGLKVKGEAEGGGYGPRRETNRDQMSTLGKRSASSFESGNFLPDEGGETGKSVSKSAVIEPSTENRMRASDIELREPRFLGNSSQYVSSRSGNQDVNKERKGGSEGLKRFNSGEL